LQLRIDTRLPPLLGAHMAPGVTIVLAIPSVLQNGLPHCRAGPSFKIDDLKVRA
jgi:hypothetical protein